MKYLFFSFTAMLLLSFTGTAQISSAHKRPGQNTHVLPASAWLETKDVTQFDTKLDSIKSESYVLKYEYDYAGRLIWETYIDSYEPEYSWKSEYIKNTAGVTEKIESYSFLNSNWVMTCYQEFLIDSLGRKTQRINVNYYDSAWNIGGKGFYYYYPDGKLKEYEQKIHVGGNVFDDLSRDLYEYDSLGNLSTVSYLFYDFGVWDTSIVDHYTFNGNKLVNITSYYNNYGTYEYDHKYDYDYAVSGNSTERRYHLSDDGYTWTSVRDKFSWRYDETQSSSNVLFPFEAEYFLDDYDWFVMNHLRTEEDWYTIDQNTWQLAYVETSYYFYSSLTGLGDDASLNKGRLSVYPNPASDQIAINNLNESSSIETISVCDCTGKVVLSVSGNATTIDIRSLTNGMYFVICTTSANETLTGKFIKK
ncbi:hypothetical protein DSECCO2_515850 [anaerobic digester metagenome]